MVNIFYLKKDRKDFLDSSIQAWFNFVGWCNSLLNNEDVSYIKSKGIKGVNLIIFMLIFLSYFSYQE